MRVLILTQYFYPETGAPQNRLYSLALYFAEQGAEVSILTAMPNYPKMEIFQGYAKRLFFTEKEGPLTIYRTYIYAKKSKSKTTRLLNYFSFAFSSMLFGYLKISKQDLIICESPPLFVGITALFLSRTKKAKLIFNVSDLWPESVEKLGIIKNKLLIKLAYKLEKRIYLGSALVSGQTEGIVENIRTRFPNVRTYLFRNGIDFTQFDIYADGTAFTNGMNITKNDFVLVYAGVLGYAQGLETVLKGAETLTGRLNIKFFIVGDGPEKEKLIEITRQKNLKNVCFIPNKSRNEIPGIIAACDAYIVPLRKLDLFLGAIPSKVFEPLAMGKPIILGVNGEARKIFIDQGKCGLYYEPENADNLANCIELLFNDRSLGHELGENGRHFVRQNFNRARIAEEFYSLINRLN